MSKDFVLTSILSYVLLANAGFMTLYSEYNDKTRLTCSAVLERPEKADCFCFSGIWLVFEEGCRNGIPMMGKSVCRIKEMDKIQKVIKLSGDVVGLGFAQQGLIIPDLHETMKRDFRLRSSATFYSGPKEFTLIGTKKNRPVKVCLKSSQGSFNVFDGAHLLIEIVKDVVEGCGDDAYEIYPDSMHHILDGEEELSCEQKSTGGLLPSYYDKEITVPRSVAVEVWNFLENQLSDVLMPKKNKDKNNQKKKKEKYSSFPVYEFLELCSQIAKKTCPYFYVKPEFIEMAIKAFIHVQDKWYNFQQIPISNKEMKGVKSSLQRCLSKAQTYPFIEDSSCRGFNIRAKLATGNYQVEGKQKELVIPTNFIALGREPVIETAWKVFVNAHSYCFSEFNNDDHHRFTTWMMQLFQNDILKDWWSGSYKNPIALLGNQKIIQTNLAYCSAYSRLHSLYPWDLRFPRSSLDEHTQLQLQQIDTSNMSSEEYSYIEKGYRESEWDDDLLLEYLDKEMIEGTSDVTMDKEDSKIDSNETALGTEDEAEYDETVTEKFGLTTEKGNDEKKVGNKEGEKKMNTDGKKNNDKEKSTTKSPKISTPTSPAISTTTSPAISTTTSPAISTTTSPAISTTNSPKISTTTSPEISTPTNPTTIPIMSPTMIAATSPTTIATTTISTPTEKNITVSNNNGESEEGNGTKIESLDKDPSNNDKTQNADKNVSSDRKRRQVGNIVAYRCLHLDELTNCRY